MNSFAIIGTGALGGFYGALLHHSGRQVHFLTRGDADVLNTKGLTVDGTNRQLICARVHAYDRAKDMPRCDVVCVCLKTTQNAALKDVLPHVVKPDGVVLVMQNGLGMEEVAAGIVGPGKVIGCLCFLAANKVAPGVVRHLGYGNVVLGEFSTREETPRLLALADDFRAAGIDVETTADLPLARWKKLVWNLAFNGLSVLLDTTTDVMMTTPVHRERVTGIMREVVAIAGACGSVIEPEFVQKMLDVTDKLKPYKTSMKLDHDAGRPMELEAIYGNVVRAAVAKGVPCPLIRAVYDGLRSL